MFIGDDPFEEYKAEMNEGVRLARIAKVNININSPVKYNTKKSEYGTVDLQFMDFGSQQIQIRIPTFQFGKSSGSLSIPEVGMGALCKFLPNSRAVIISTFSLGDETGKDFIFLKDFVDAGVLPQLQEGEHIFWAGNKALHLIRLCTKKITHTVGKLLDAAKNAIQVNGKDIHYAVEHESGLKIYVDENGALIFKVPSGQKIFLNTDGGTAADEDALVTKKFINDKYNDFINTVYNIHTHPYLNVTVPAVTSPTTSQGVIVSPTMPDGVCTPDVRAKL